MPEKEKTSRADNADEGRRRTADESRKESAAQRTGAPGDPEVRPPETAQSP